MGLTGGTPSPPRQALRNFIVPNMFPWSVSASRSMPSSRVRATSESIDEAPSSSE